MPRKDLTLADKIAILESIKNHPSTTYSQLAKINGVSKTTIARLISQKDRLRTDWEGKQKKSQKRKREGKDPEVEEALSKWFSIVTEKGVHVSGPMLKSKSEELARKLGHVNFKVTDGWFSRWKKRYEIKFKQVRVKKNSGDAVTHEQWKLNKLPELFKFHPDDIYNVNETGLFYRAAPDGSFNYKYENLLSSKKALDRVTVLCCSNMSGSDKKKLLIIGKHVKPQCFKGLRMDSLPVSYHANKNAKMTSSIFEKWLADWDEDLQQKSRKVLLLLDNSSSHPHLTCLRNIQLEFIPADTSLIQPLDMGILKNFKILYRGKLVQFILEAIEENYLTSSSAAKEISRKITILQALQIAADSWREISSKTIQNCFSQFVFTRTEQNLSDIEPEITLELEKVTNYDEYLAIDSTLHCHNETEDFEDTILEQILSKHLKSSEDNDDDEDGDTPEQVTDQEAKKCVVQLRRYFMQDGNEGSPSTALDACYDFIQSQYIKKMRQTVSN